MIRNLVETCSIQNNTLEVLLIMSMQCGIHNKLWHSEIVSLYVHFLSVRMASYVETVKVNWNFRHSYYMHLGVTICIKWKFKILLHHCSSLKIEGYTFCSSPLKCFIPLLAFYENLDTYFNFSCNCFIQLFQLILQGGIEG